MSGSNTQSSLHLMIIELPLLTWAVPGISPPTLPHMHCQMGHQWGH